MGNDDSFSYGDLCSTCTNNCCEGVDSPPVFSTDFNKLEKIGKSSDEYIKYLKLAEGKYLTQIKKKPNTNQCVFFDSEKKQCGIYENRPLDCRMYPFDVEVIDGEPWWIVYACNKNSDWSWTEAHLKKFEEEPEFEELMQNIILYDLYVTQEFDYRGHKETPIRKVNWKPQQKIEK
jgi:uncharacterized protein